MWRFVAKLNTRILEVGSMALMICVEKGDLVTAAAIVDSSGRLLILRRSIVVTGYTHVSMTRQLGY
jgi:hypothetical protein